MAAEGDTQTVLVNKNVTTLANIRQGCSLVDAAQVELPITGPASL